MSNIQYFISTHQLDTDLTGGGASKNIVEPRSVDAYWLQREINKYMNDPLVITVQFMVYCSHVSCYLRHRRRRLMKCWKFLRWVELQHMLTV